MVCDFQSQQFTSFISIDTDSVNVIDQF